MLFLSMINEKVIDMIPEKVIRGKNIKKKKKLYLFFVDSRKHLIK